MYDISDAQMVAVNKLFLDELNPRHEPLPDASAVVSYLCKDEKVLPLAVDIAKHGLNPLELLAVTPIKTKSKSTKAINFVVLEGNRRLCAIKLLNDPDLAPPELRASFQEAAKNWQPLKKISVISFRNKDDVKIWLDRLHGGELNGTGRRKWSSEQKQRASGNPKNKLAQEILDYAQRAGFITAGQRKGKLSIVQRFLGNPQMREALGIESSIDGGIQRFKKEADFQILLNEFITDLLPDDSGKAKINTRANKGIILAYARGLAANKEVSGELSEPVDLNPNADESSNTTKTQKPNKPPKPSKLKYDKAAYDALDAIDCYKLKLLYYSVCEVNLNNHTPLLCVGVWSLIESICQLDGKEPKTSFCAYLSKNKLKNLGLSDSVSLRDSLQRIQSQGNATKHHGTAALFNGEQLYNDFELLNEVIIKLAENIKSAA